MENLKPLEEQYADKIAKGDALLLKAKPISTVEKIIRVSVIVIGIILTFYLTDFSLDSFIYDCGMIGSISVNLLMKNGMSILLRFILTILFLRILYDMKQGRKTGWDGNPNKTVYRDTILFKYTLETHKQRKKIAWLYGVFTVISLILTPNWTAINESSSFAEANEFAHQQCMAEKVEREREK